jgi:hypothetical protein
MLFALLAVGNLPAEAQLERTFKARSPDYPMMSGFSSVFSAHKNGDFQGTLNGVLFLQKNGSDKISEFTFCNEKASLHVEADPDSIYDVSRKHRLFKRSDIQLRYTTYADASCFEVIVGTDTVSISTIDGCCCTVINELESTYSADEGTERLYLYVPTDMGLWKRRVRISSYAVKAGSMLCFDISRRK